VGARVSGHSRECRQAAGDGHGQSQPLALLRAIWYMLSRSVPHRDLGLTYFETDDVARDTRHHVRRLAQLGYRVVVEPAA
jgi:hypothetical protein